MSPNAGLDEQAVLNVLKTVQDPDLHRDIVSLGFIKDLKIDGSRVSFKVELTTPACPVKDQLKAECEQLIDIATDDMAVVHDGATFAEPHDSIIVHRSKVNPAQVYQRDDPIWDDARQQAAADGQGDEDLVGGVPHHLVHDAALFVRGGDVEKDEFVGPGGVVKTRLLHRIAGIDQVDEVNPFDHPPPVYVEAGDDAFGY